MDDFIFTFKKDGKTYSISGEELKKFEVDDGQTGGDNGNSENDYTPYSQMDPRWKNIKLGNGRTTIGTHGCFVACLAMIDGRTPDVINKVLRENNAFYIDLVKSPEAAKALNLEYKGKDYDISNMPEYSPSIKEVKYGSAGTQHFVLRIIKNGVRYIIDPIDGKQKAINYYPFVSYRLFKKKD